MRKTVIAIAVLPILAACTSTNGEDLTPIASPAGGEMVCNADAVQSHLGHSASQEMGAAILAESGAQTLRWGAPGSVWTMDYRTDRVNVRYDENRKIIEITCG